MTDAWVVNASPLITLAKAGHLGLLDEPGIDVLVPEAVVREVLAGHRSDPARLALQEGWGAKIQVDEVPDDVLEWSLGRGESEVIAAALERPGSIALLDDAEGRACARVLGVKIMGTLGLVMRARRLGRIESAAGLVRDLRAAGLYLDDRVVREALDRVAKERWE